jgi:glucan phosphoethanolaminetransferase (alkaline phosphatase superfamily)
MCTCFKEFDTEFLRICLSLIIPLLLLLLLLLHQCITFHILIWFILILTKVIRSFFYKDISESDTFCSLELFLFMLYWCKFHEHVGCHFTMYLLTNIYNWLKWKEAYNTQMVKVEYPMIWNSLRLYLILN